jgi:hypothetical protein
MDDALPLEATTRVAIAECEPLESGLLDIGAVPLLLVVG